MRIILVSLCTLLFGLILTILARRTAHRTGLVAAPRQDRWHSKPTAMLGGVAIYAAFIIGYAFFLPNLPASYPIIAGGSLLFFTGLIDDINPIKPYAKLVIQLIAAAMAVYFGLHLPWVNYQWINDFLTIFWLIGITNAINLLDNMDGLAGGVSFISCVFLTITFLLNGQTQEAMLPALLGGAVLGFLAFNFSPASIFMGDCGSMFLGFMLEWNGASERDRAFSQSGIRAADARADTDDSHIRYVHGDDNAAVVGPPDFAGRARSHFAQARSVRHIGAPRGVDALFVCDCDGRAGPDGETA